MEEGRGEEEGGGGGEGGRGGEGLQMRFREDGVDAETLTPLVTSPEGESARNYSFSGVNIDEATLDQNAKTLNQIF